MFSLDHVHVGCTVTVQRPLLNGTTENRVAEILSARDEAGTRQFYVHYDNFNKRLDEWIQSSWIDRKEPLVPKKIEGDAKKTKAPSQPKIKISGRSESPSDSLPSSRHASPAPSFSNSQPAPSLLKRAISNATSQPKKRKITPEPLPRSTRSSPRGSSDLEAVSDTSQDEESETEDAQGETDDELLPVDSTMAHANPTTFSKTDEIEKLRTSGSMTQNTHEISRVKNLQAIRMGKHIVEAWYFSPYPLEYAHTPLLHLCEFCLSPFNDMTTITRHRQKCTMRHPPGNEIYRNGPISFWEIDGRKQKAWCRNLCLISKCFLDHKTLYYDVDPFLFYILTKRDEVGWHTLGYFSKEKESAEGYNLACILTLPQHQRQGWGTLLMDFSYALSKREGKFGSPEKPLSDLGLLGYRAYWSEAIIGLLTQLSQTSYDVDHITIDEISQRTGIIPTDIIYTLQSLQMLPLQRGQYVIALTDGHIQQYQRALEKIQSVAKDGRGDRRVDMDKIIWRPPIFTREQLRFGW